GDEVILFRLHAAPPLAAAILRTVGGKRRALGIAAMGDHDDHVLAFNKGLVLEIEVGFLKFRTTRDGELAADLAKLALDDRHHARAAREDVDIVFDIFGKSLGFLADLVAPEAG